MCFSNAVDRYRGDSAFSKHPILFSRSIHYLLVVNINFKVEIWYDENYRVFVIFWRWPTYYQATCVLPVYCWSPNTHIRSRHILTTRKCNQYLKLPYLRCRFFTDVRATVTTLVITVQKIRIYTFLYAECPQKHVGRVHFYNENLEHC